MTQAEIIERIGFGCNGDRNEALFRAGYRPLRQSPFNPQSYEYVSYTHIDRSAEEEGIAFVRTRDLRSGSRTPAMTSDATMRGDIGSEMRHDQLEDRPFASLTRHQLEALRQVALGLTNAQIAELRGTSVKAVERVVARALAAAGVDTEEAGNSRVNAARRFIVVSGQPVALPEDTGAGE